MFCARNTKVVFCVALISTLSLACNRGNSLTASRSIKKCTNGKSKIKNKKFSAKKPKSNKVYSYGGSSLTSSTNNRSLSQSKSASSTQPVEQSNQITDTLLQAAENPLPFNDVHYNGNTPVETASLPSLSNPNTSTNPIDDATSNALSPNATSNFPQKEPLASPSTERDSVNTISTSVPNLGANKRDVTQPKLIIFRGQQYEENETIEFEEKITFIPNHTILDNETDAKNKLSDLRDFMNTYPSAEVRIIGHAGWDLPPDEPRPKYQIDPNRDDGSLIPILYGRGPAVYAQTLFVDDFGENLERVLEAEVKPVTEVVLGTLLRHRAYKIKDLLDEMGIDKKRVKIGLGEFTGEPNHFVTFKAKVKTKKKKRP